MDKFRAGLAAILIGAGVAVTYYVFEASLRLSTDYIWNDLFDTDDQRWLVLPLCLVISLAFFGAQHWLDPKSEKQKEQSSLGGSPKPKISNYLKVLLIGFLSLLAGASLGPEAILIPASVIVGGYIGSAFQKKKVYDKNIFATVGFVAIFASFFSSIIAGLLGLLLLVKQGSAELNAKTLIMSGFSALAVVATLGFLSPPSYIGYSQGSSKLTPLVLAVFLGLLVLGYCITYVISKLLSVAEIVLKRLATEKWWQKGLISALGLSALYLLGGSLVEFTGNESISSVHQQASSLGILGLIWIAIIKLMAISWSRAVGYRGGMIFPTVLVASIITAIAQLLVSDVNFSYGILAVMIGVFISNNKLKTLF